MGGKLGDYQDRNDVWASTDGSTWTKTTAAAQWTRRSNHVSVVFDNKLWIIGGYLETSILNPVYRNDVWFSSDGQNWTCATAQAEWPARGYFEAVAFDNKMWIIGGVSSTKMYNDMWYSTDGKKWTQATPAATWKARYDFQSVVFDNKIWVIAGISGSTCLNDVWYYDMPTGIGNHIEAASPAIPLTVDAVRSTPSGGTMTIRYTLLKTGNVRIDVYTFAGKKIRTLRDGVQCAGEHALEWNRREAGGKTVGAGAYFVRIGIDGLEEIRMVVNSL